MLKKKCNRNILIFFAHQPKSIGILSLTNKYRHNLLLWQQFIPENIQDMHSDIKKTKHNELATGYGTYRIMFYPVMYRGWSTFWVIFFSKTDLISLPFICQITFYLNTLFATTRTFLSLAFELCFHSQTLFQHECMSLDYTLWLLINSIYYFAYSSILHILRHNLQDVIFTTGRK